jgi:hypothetical protein
MSSRRDQERRLIIRQGVLGLTVTCSTTIAEIATYSGPIDMKHVVLFGISGLLAGAVTLSASLPFKKNLRIPVSLQRAVYTTAVF